jgi:branched-chain amino acid transport system substrate-binding protein
MDDIPPLQSILETARLSKGVENMMSKKPRDILQLARRFYLLIMLLCTVIILVAGCKKEPVRIGFVADLAGKQAELGVQERNGVELAVEKINDAGGVAGRKLELVIRDDRGTFDGAQFADRQLIEAGVVAIIGHATSSQAVAGLQVTEPAQVVLMGPTVSSPVLTGKYQYFFRVYPSFADSAKGFAKYILHERKLTRVAIIYDSNNMAYSDTYKNIFVDNFKNMGGTVADAISFSSTEKTDFDVMLTKLRADGADGLLLITADVDAAIIAQRTRLAGWQVPLFASAWAQTATLIYNGGRAVEGMELEQAYALSSDDPDFLDFEKRYRERYGTGPSFGAAFGYETVLVLGAALQRNGGKSEGLRQALLDTKNFKGLIDTFSFDQYGDVQRPFYLSVIHDNKFVIRGKLTGT